MTPDEPAAGPTPVAGLRLPEVLPPIVSGRRALFPLHERFAPRVDVCALVEAGSITFVARDVLEAIGHEPGNYAADPSHEPPASFQAHATATTWSRELLGDILAPITEDEPVRSFLRWLDRHIEALELIGLPAVEHRVLHGTRHAAPAVDPTPDAAPSLPEYYSVAAAAKILSRDPAIATMGRLTLFEWMHQRGWTERHENVWKPSRDLLVIGYLTTQGRNVPAFSHSEPYPQILITPMGIHAIHERLGGTADIDLTRSHLTLIGE